MVRYKCRVCGDKLEAPKSQVGQSQKCPSCGEITVVPKADWVLRSTLAASCLFLVGGFVLFESIGGWEADRSTKDWGLLSFCLFVAGFGCGIACLVRWHNKRRTATPRGKRRTRDAYTCPSRTCRYAGPAEIRPKPGGGWIIAILLLAGLIPGIIAALVLGGYELFCARCGEYIGKR